MFTVTTFHLSNDTTRADPALGPSELGVLTAEEFAALLTRFSRLDRVQNHEADPHLLVTAAAGRFLIRTGQGKLFLYNARDTTEPYSELGATELVALLDRPVTSAPFPDIVPEPVPTKSAPRYGIAGAILAAGLALNGYTLYAAFYTESVNKKPAVTLLTDSNELAARAREAVGAYSTGSQPGDRVITITSDGKIRFSEIGANESLATTDTFKLGRHDNKFCLLTPESDLVDFANPDTLVYYRDTYRRNTR